MSSIFNMADVWNAGGTTFTAIKMNVTDTASAAASMLMDLQVAGVSKFSVSKAGGGTFAGQLIGAGTATNDSASAGQIGETIVSEVLVGSAVPLTDNTDANVTSISLTAGDWDVEGNVALTVGAGTLVTRIAAWTSTTSASIPTAPNQGGYSIFHVNFVASAAQIIPVGTRRFSLASTTTVYLSARASFTVSTAAAYGYLRARRVR